MRIHGFQKLTLLDFPGKMACIVFTGGCNFVCPFCHNSRLIADKDLPSIAEEEVSDYLKKRAGILEGVVISGGEPLLQPDLKEFLTKIKALGYPVKLDTNGSIPDRLEELVNAGLIDYIAMDIKNSPAKYALTAGLESIDIGKIKRSVEIIMNSGIDYEFRTTVIKEFHEQADFEKIGRWLTGAKAFFLQNFRDSEGVVYDGLHPVSKNDLIDAKNILNRYIVNVSIRGE